MESDTSLLNVRLPIGAMDDLDHIADTYRLAKEQAVYRAVSLVKYISDELTDEQIPDRQLESCDQVGLRRRRLILEYNQPSADQRREWLNIQIHAVTVDTLEQLAQRHSASLEQVMSESIALYKDLSDEVEHNRVVRICRPNGSHVVRLSGPDTIWFAR